MPVGRRDRAVSEVIGFVLIFSILVISFSIYQGIVVPQQNQAAEFTHNQRAQADLLNLRDGILRTGTTGVSQSTTVTVGADYPRRTVAINFGVTGGTLETEQATPGGSNAIHIENITALDDETADYLNNSAIQLAFPTKEIVFSPTYTYYGDPPTTRISLGTVFNDFSGTDLPVSDQIIVSGRTITLVAINGSLSKGTFGEAATVTVDTKPLSVATTSVTVENNRSGRPITITLPTRVDDPAVWEDAGLAAELVANGGFVTDVRSDRANQITITLQEGKTYTLRMASVGVGTDTTAPTAAYLTDVETPAETVSENTSHEIVLEVRDKFNNPVDGFQVNASIDRSSDNTNGTLSVVGESDQTDGSPPSESVSANTSNGRATFSYAAPDVASDQVVNLNFTISTGAPDAHERVWVNTTVLANGGNDGGGGGDGSGGDSGSDTVNPSSTEESLVWIGAGVPNNGDDVSVQFENAASSAISIESVRYQFYSEDSQGGGGGINPPESFTITDADGSGVTGAINYLGTFQDVSSDLDDVAAGGTPTYTFKFYANENAAGSRFDADAGDFFIISVKYTVSGNTKTATYFVGISTP